MQDSSARITVLRSQLEAAFPLRTFALNIAGQRLEVTTANDIEELINRISEEEFRIDERLPYWAEVWHSAVALGEFLALHGELVAGQEALEIGCGLGVSGMVAARMGAQVTFADYDQQALAAAEYNFLVNCPGYQGQFELMDFRSPPGRRWRVILAADVIYERRFVSPLAAFFDSTLSSDGCILLAEPNRMIAVPFFEEMEARGFRYERTSHETQLHGRMVEISVYRISRRTHV